MFTQSLEKALEGIRHAFERAFSLFSGSSELNALRTMLQVLSLLEEAQEVLELRPLDRDELIRTSIQVGLYSLSLSFYSPSPTHGCVLLSPVESSRESLCRVVGQL